MQTEQADYFQAVKGGGNGGYKSIVLAPGSTREMAEHIFTLFNLTDKYRMPGILLADGLLAQLESDFIFPETNIEFVDKSSWAIGKNSGDREPRAIKSLRLGKDELEAHKNHLHKKYEEIKQKEVRVEEYLTEDAETILVSYGFVSTTSKEAINEMRKEGKKIGLLRPITLWPFPHNKLEELSKNSKNILVAELNDGQMVEDVRLAVNGNCPVHFYGRSGGNLITKKELIKRIKEI